MVPSAQVLVRRELEEAAKVLGERIRTNEASCEVGKCPPSVRPGIPCLPPNMHARQQARSLH